MATGFTEFLDNFVNKHNDRQLLALPLAILAVSLIILLDSFVNTGSPVTLGMEFQGGTQISVETTDSPAVLKEAFSSYPIYGCPCKPEAGLSWSSGSWTMRNNVSSKMMSRADTLMWKFRQIGPIYGQELQVQAIRALIISFIGMAIVVFLLFRSLIPSFAVILVCFFGHHNCPCFHEGCRG